MSSERKCVVAAVLSHLLEGLGYLLVSSEGDLRLITCESVVPDDILHDPIIVVVGVKERLQIRIASPLFTHADCSSLEPKQFGGLEFVLTDLLADWEELMSVHLLDVIVALSYTSHLHVRICVCICMYTYVYVCICM